MATPTIEKSQELREGTTSRLAVESPGETVIACPLPFGPDEPLPDEPLNEEYAKGSLAEATATNVSMPIHRDGFLTSLVGRLAVFNDWFVGPPLSKQDCVNAQLLRARDQLAWPG